MRHREWWSRVGGIVTVRVRKGLSGVVIHVVRG